MSRSNHWAIEVSHLRKSYGPTIAVDDVSLAVRHGEIFGILGPNGAGKTTTVECVVGLRTPDSGSVRVLGLDPAEERDQLHQVVGVQLQSSTLPAKLRVREILDLYRSFYRQPADASELLDTLGLAGKSDDFYRALSGGQRQRLSLALALVGRPRVAVLDEMTTGLDPQARRDTWGLIESIRERDVTVILVTHFMEEAERLCDRVALIAQGNLIALDTPARLIAGARDNKRVRFIPSAPFDEHLLTRLPEVSTLTRHGDEVAVTGNGQLVNQIILTLADAGVTALDVELGHANLEDAFMSLTGSDHRLEREAV